MRLPDIFKNPRMAAIAGVILGLALGLLVGWVLWPVKYTDAVPANPKSAISGGVPAHGGGFLSH